MITDFTPELFWLAATALLTAFLWVPYILAFIFQLGPVTAIEGGQYATPIESHWADRAKRAHSNAVENLVVFAALALVVHITQSGTELTANAAMVFFFARAAHYVIYTLKIPYLRVVAFTAGFICQAILGFTLFGWL